MPSVCYFTADFSGAGCYRCLFPGRELNRQFGWETFVPEPREVKPGLFMFELGKVPSADIYVLQQRPEKEWFKLIPFLRDRGKIIVCETDDYYLGIPTWHPAYESTRKLVEPLHRLYRLADAMTVSTPFLEQQYRRYNPNIRLIPNYWDEEMWADPPERTWERLRVGWMGVAKFRPSDMQVLKGMIGPWLRRHPEVDFVAAGDPSVHDILDVPEGQRVSLPRVHFPQTPSLMQFDIGLVPLSRHDFNEGKSYLKGMEYNVCGIPYIASPSGPYKDYTVEGRNGFLARRPKDWIRHLDCLVEDAALRREMSAAARDTAAQYKLKDHAGEWHDFFTSLLGDRYDQLARDAIEKYALQKPDELAPFLRYVGRKLGSPRVVVEIGTAQGGMLYALAQVAADDALIVSIDLPGGDLDEVSEDDKYGARDTDKMAAYVQPGQRVEFLQLDSHHPSTRATLERILDGRQIDLLFIDGDHSYGGVKQDFEMYRGLVRPGGLVGFHDVEVHDGTNIQVHKFWREVKQEYAGVQEFYAPGNWGWGPWGGIGVLERGTEIREKEMAA